MQITANDDIKMTENTDMKIRHNTSTTVILALFFFLRDVVQRFPTDRNDGGGTPGAPWDLETGPTRCADEYLH